MQSLPVSILGFACCAALIIYSGSRLSKYGDLIAELTGIGKAWFGLVMMSVVTSLPELFTGVSSIIVVGSPDIAVGDIMGSCAFNLLILAIIDYFVPGKPISALVTTEHIVAGFLGMFLVTLAVITIVFGNMIPTIGWVSVSSVIMILLYFVSVKIMFGNKSSGTQNNQTNTSRENHQLSLVIRKYIFFAVLVIAGALALPYFADSLAEQAGLSKSFVGTLLVAASTSLPELVVSIAAVRMGSMDMAVGNLLGSNVFNMLILSIDDIMYTNGPILSSVNPIHALSGLFTLLMTSVVGIGILQHVPKKRLVLGIDALIIIILYLILIISLFIIDNHQS
ncbi:MAG TPA: sodium:proton exchanger [Chitinophagaceae bacterium]|nr:sodium:proton exchanger [Chitinophagaceae bacterium]